MSVKSFFLTWILHRQVPHYRFGMCCRFLSHFFFVYYSPTYEFPHFHNSLTTTLPRKWSLQYGADWISRASFSPELQPLGCAIQSYFSDQWSVPLMYMSLRMLPRAHRKLNGRHVLGGKNGVIFRMNKYRVVQFERIWLNFGRPMPILPPRLFKAKVNELFLLKNSECYAMHVATGVRGGAIAPPKFVLAPPKENSEWFQI